MFTKYFGNFLFESGVITLEQFKHALQQIPEKRARLGVLAIEAGFMTPEQVEETHVVQLQVDRKFGEIAVEKGFVTGGQLESLLSRQSSPFSVFSQIMCDEGYMTYAQLAEQLERYRQKCGMSEESFNRFKNGDIAPIVRKIASGAGQDTGSVNIFADYIEVFAKNILRFVSDNVTLGEIGTAAPAGGELSARQGITGDREMTTSFSGGREAMLYFCSKFARRKFADLDIMARDILGEFLNCSNGIFIANMYEAGLRLDLEPQQVTEEVPNPSSHQALVIPILIEDYAYQLSVELH